MAGIQPIRLSCEHRTDPLGIGEVRPRLGWALESDERAQIQSAYRILVAGDEANLETEEDFLWDSGKVPSDQSLGIEYEGEALRSGARCVWSVRVWNAEGESSTSEPAVFETGLLEKSDWEGAWISAGEGPSGDMEPPTGDEYDDVGNGLAPSPYLRRSFTLKSGVRRARLYSTARGVYEMHVNGSRVGDDVFAPGWTDYRRRIQYQAYDVTRLLQPGENVLGGILGDGWYAGFFGFDPKKRGAHYGVRPQLLVQLNIEYEDGTRDSVVTDGSWKWSPGPILYSDLLMGESYDARQEMPGWEGPGFDDSEWYQVDRGELDASMLVAQPDEGVRVTQEVAAISVTEPEPGVFVFDMGQNMVGWARLKVEGEAGTSVRMRFAEALNPDGTIYTENLRSARQADAYVLKGGGEEIYEPRFTFHGFHYVEVTGYPGEPPLDAITGRVVHSDTPPTGSFECSSEMVNRLQGNIVWGQRGNFLSIPTDCPQRDERLGWMGDAQIFVRTASYNMDVAAFFAKWMVDVEDAQSSDGAFSDVVPLLEGSGVIDLSRGAPAWGDAGIIVPWTIYRTYGDTRIIERHYEAMTRWMDYLHDANPDLLRRNKLGNNYGDWLSPKGDRTPKDLLATAYWAYDAGLMSEMAAAVGRGEDAKRYADLRDAIQNAFVQAYVAPDGRVESEAQTAYALALHMDLLPEEVREPAAGHLVDAIEREDWHLSTGFVGVGYLCPVLTEAGYPEVAYRLLNNDTFPSWGYTIQNGATAIWERWDGWTEAHGFQSPNMNSFNHYSLGSVGEWLYRYVAGIDAASPGFGHVLIHPCPGGGLTHARAGYDSVRGRIESGWEISESEFRLNVTIPPNTTATVHVPAADRARVTEGGGPAAEAYGVELVRADGDAAVFSVGSGRYEFIGRVPG